MTDNALMILENGNPKELFVMNGLDAFINKIKEEVAEAPKDISTEKGRKEIASLAYKVAKSKTALEKLGKESIEDLQKTVKAVTAERIRGVNALQEIQDEIRKPLTEWEEAEKARVARHEEVIATIKSAGEQSALLWQSLPITEMQKMLDDVNLQDRDWQEFNYRAAEAIKIAIEQTQTAISKRTAYDAEQAELVRLRAEQIAREQKEREDKIAAEAAEKARLEAERIAKEAAEKAEQEAKAESDRQEREKQEAVARAEKAEADRIAAEKKANEEKLAAAAKAEKEKQEAVEAEKKRQADEAAKLAAETAKREADLEHKKKINNDALLGILSVIYSQPPEECTEAQKNTGKNLIKAIASGQIAHIKINY